MKIDEARVSPDLISNLKPDEVFCFGSNLQGLHSAGAAQTAFNYFGAVFGIGVGESGQSYAIPTVDLYGYGTLRLSVIAEFVSEFIEHAGLNPQKRYLVTEIGCGIAGYQPFDIAPLFLKAIHVENIALPKSFWDILVGDDTDEL